MHVSLIWFTKRFGRILLPMKKYSILLVDDHRIFLEGLKNLIQEPFQAKDTANSGREALELIKSSEFDVMITDYEMPGFNGLELIKAVRIVQPEIKIIVLSMHDDPSVVKELLRIGVQGYLLKNNTYKNLTEALEKVVEGKRFLSDEIAELLINAPEEEEKGVLTSREIEILKLVAKEFNSRQIAEILFISERTVETHRKNIFRKTNTSSVIGLVKYAYEHKLI